MIIIISYFITVFSLPVSSNTPGCLASGLLSLSNCDPLSKLNKPDLDWAVVILHNGKNGTRTLLAETEEYGDL